MMNNHAEKAALQAFANSEIAPLLKQMREARAAAWGKVRRGAALGVAAGLALAVVLHVLLADAPLPKLMLIMGPTGVLLGTLPGWTALTKAKKGFADAHIGKIATFLGFEYTAKGFAPPRFDDFAHSGLLPSFDRKSFSRLIAGERQGAPAAVYEAELKQWQTRTTGKTTRRELVTVFDGQLLHRAYPHKFAGRTLVLRDKGWLNAIDGLDAPKGLKRVRLADPHFEKIFEVYSTDQVEGRYLVDPLFMERLMAMEERYRLRIPNVAFVEGAMLVTLSGENKFLSSLGKEGTDALDLTQETITGIDRVFALLDGLAGDHGPS